MSAEKSELAYIIKTRNVDYIGLKIFEGLFNDLAVFPEERIVLEITVDRHRGAAAFQVEKLDAAFSAERRFLARTDAQKRIFVFLGKSGKAA